MDAFLAEEVVFKDMPANCKGSSQSIKVDVVGRKATKIVTRTCKLTDDTEVVLTVTASRTFDKAPGMPSDDDDSDKSVNLSQEEDYEDDGFEDQSPRVEETKTPAAAANDTI